MCRTLLKFHGVRPPEYPGGRRLGCKTEDPEATSWGVSIGGAHFFFNSPEDVVKGVQRMITEAYYLGVSETRDKIRKKLGL